MRYVILAVVTGLLATPLIAQNAPTPAPARDTYQGVVVTDPERWLENGKDPAVKAWVARQNAASRGYIDGLPSRPAIAKALDRIENTFSVADRGLVEAGGKLFAYTYNPGAQQPQITMLTLSDTTVARRVVIDPLKLSTDGSVAVDWFDPSPDGKLIAVSQSANGSEDGTLHIYDVATGREVEAPIPHVQFPTAGGSMAWRADSSGFWYTRYPGDDTPAADRHFFQRAYYHRLGTALKDDALVLGEKDGLPRTGEIFLSNPRGADMALASVELGDGGDYQHFLLTPTGARKVIGYDAKVKAATLDRDGTVYGITVKNAPNGAIVKYAPGAAGSTVIVPQGRTALVLDAPDKSLVISGDRLFVAGIDGGPNVLNSYRKDGSGARPIDVPAVSTVGEMTAMSSGDLLYRVRSYIVPSHSMLWQVGTGRSVATPLAVVSPLDYTQYEVRRMFATSKDGTKVPISLIARKGMRLDGSTPTLLYGYGGYGVNMSPSYLPPMAYLLLRAGGAYAIANIRGGGEYGERWHRQGMLTAKQNVFDDFAAAADYLKAQKVTSTAKLALMGGSNGGLLMGATLTQRPDIAKAVISEVGIYDMLRVELDPNGSFNVTEFGSVKDPAQFRALYAYSPLHHVVKGRQYPAIFLATGDNDGRVNPMHSRKFAAALQASGSKAPVYLRTSAKAGHGMGSSLDEVTALEADETAFLFDQLGLTFVPF